VLRALEIGLQRAQWVAEDPIDADRRGQVIHDFGLVDETLDQIGIEDGAFDELDVGSIGARGQILASPGGEIIKDSDVLAALGQALDEVRADEARPAGDEHARH
jgi:hypothetical protein